MTNNLLTTVEAAEYLGMKKSYLHKLMMKKEPVYFKQPFSYFSNIHLYSGVM